MSQVSLLVHIENVTSDSISSTSVHLCTAYCNCNGRYVTSYLGKNFVFDKREAFSAGDSEGVGGVIRQTALSDVDHREEKAGAGGGGNLVDMGGGVGEGSNEKKKKRRKNKSKTEEASSGKAEEVVLSKCCVCSVPWDRYVGKKKCYTCGVPILLCESCCTKKVDKLETTKASVKCPLCVSENITIPAALVTFTNNGKNVKGMLNGVSAIASGVAKGAAAEPKVATTVCKWGGGHASEKHKLKTETKIKDKVGSRPCKYGASCTRTDCWFTH